MFLIRLHIVTHLLENNKKTELSKIKIIKLQKGIIRNQKLVERQKRKAIDVAQEEKQVFEQYKCV
jgi:hypothetical protein